MLITRYLRSTVTAAESLREGGIVAFPTETVYGLGVDATNAGAVSRLFAAKGRPADNPLIVHIGDTHQWRLVAAELTDSAGRFLDAFAPGPLTVVLRKHPSICSAVTAGLPTVGLRIPDSQLARELLRAVELPIAAPSANLSGRPSCTTWQGVAEDLDGRIDAILQGEPCRVGLESTVVDCTRPEPVVLRAGGVSLEQLRSIVPTTRLAESLESLGAPAPKPTARRKHSGGVEVVSPGTRHPHYQPRGRVCLLDPTVPRAVGGADMLEQHCCVGRWAYCGLGPPPPWLESKPMIYQVRFDSLEAYAHGFFEFLRECDRRGVELLWVELAPDHGLGRAVRDRQRRAAAQ